MDTHVARDPAAVFAKTAAGQQEIQTRGLGLSLLVRRLMVLVDGRRTVAELCGFAPGQDAGPLLDELLAKGCIAPVQVQHRPASAAPAAPTATAQPAPATAEPGAEVLAALPPADQRNVQDVEMARNFMANSINALADPGVGLALARNITKCAGAAELRGLYAEWEAALGSSWAGAKRLPELRKKLFAVL